MTATSLLNFFLTHSFVWSLNYFFLTLYLVVCITIILYTVPNLLEFTSSRTHLRKQTFTFLSGASLITVFSTPLVLLTMVLLSWTGPVVVTWYSHIIFSMWQYRLTYLIVLNFYIYIIITAANILFTSNNPYDFTIVLYSFFFWVNFLFTANNFFTFIFFIEVISTLVILLLISSTFSNTFFFNTRNLVKHSYLQSSTPEALLGAALFFFWISLMSSLFLFLFLTLFYLKTFSFDWYLTEIIFNFVLCTADLKHIFSFSLAWVLISFCLFLKCGLAPFFFWKPTFFKGLSVHTLFFYIFYYYFFLILFLTYFFLVYMSEIFFFNTTTTLALILVGTACIFFILFESYYIKTFLAVSSILNTLLIFLAMTGSQVSDLALSL